MGHVLRVLDVVLEREVAVKVLRDAEVSEATRERFVREARALARLQHPNVVAVYRIGQVLDRPYLAYELVEGTTLESNTRTPTRWPEAVELLRQLVTGLAAAHRAGILHRDIKPANAVVSREGAVKLIDFGLAQVLGERAPSDPSPVEPNPAERPADPNTEPPKPTRDDEPTRPVRRTDAPLGAAAADDDGARGDVVPHDDDTLELRVVATPRPSPFDSPLTEPGAVLGTPRYLAPERWLGEPATAAADVWAVGVVAREMLLGRPAFVGSNVARAIVSDVLPPLAEELPDLPPALAELLDRCVAREPRERFASAEELREALEAFVARQRIAGALVDPSLRSPAVDPDDATLLQRVCGPIVARTDFVASLYTRLFAARPDLRGLFPADLTAQRRKLADALESVIAALREPLALRSSAEALGARHVAYGVRPTDLDPLATALNESLRDFGAFATDGVEAAWDRAFSDVADAFLRGMARASQARESRSPSASRPRTRYVQSGASSIAFQTLGDGARGIVVALGWVSHLEAAWTLPGYARWLERLASFGRVVVFDKRGSGLSCRRDVMLPLEERATDLLRVMDAVAMDRATVIGMEDGAAAALFAAASAPERIHRLVLHGAGRRLLANDEYPQGLSRERLEGARRMIFEEWGAPLFLETIAPSRVGDLSLRTAWADYLRSAASPGSASGLLDESALLDVGPLLDVVDVPTLLIHRRGDRLMSLAGARLLREGLRRPSWAPLDGDDHLPWLGDVDAWMGAFERFFRERPSDAPPSRLVATVDVDGPGADDLRHRLLRSGLRERDGRAIAHGPAAVLAATWAARRPDARALVDVCRDEDELAPRHPMLDHVPMGELAITPSALKLAAGGAFWYEPAGEVSLVRA
jgi:serine/threonine protein kinase/pimeloyl-ACP methyl ester carboxylesterase/hemoglobin-like flavoprotein